MGIRRWQKQWVAVMCAVITACANFSGALPLKGALAGELTSEMYPASTTVLTTDSPTAPILDVSNTPEPLTDTNAPGLIETIPPPVSQVLAAEALSIDSLYLDSSQTVCQEQTAALKLVLAANNATGALLQPFGIRINIPDDIPLKVSSINRTEFVRFTRQTLWVEGAVVQDGRVTVAGEELRLTLDLLPFPTGSLLTNACVLMVLLDENGNEISLKENEQSHSLIRLSVVFQREQQDESIPEPNGTKQESEANACAKDQEPLKDSQQQMADSTYTPPPLTIEPDDSNAVTSPVDAANTQNQTQMQAAAPSFEPSAPPVKRQLQLAANIPYSKLKIGDTLQLTAVITGYEGLKIRIQWQQCSQDEWTNLEGENNDTLTMLMTPNNIYCAWRYDVTVEE